MKIIYATLIMIYLSTTCYAQNTGIGTTNPTEKLEVNGKIKITDGMQKDGSVLTSDANGVATWKPVASVNVDGDLGLTNRVPLATAAGGKYMGPTITLPEGKWIVNLGFLMNGANAANSFYAARFTLSSSKTAIQENDFKFINNNKVLLSTFSTGGDGGPSSFSFFASGVIRVEVKAASVTLYLWDNDTYKFDSYLGPESPYLDDNAENYLFAIRAN